MRQLAQKLIQLLLAIRQLPPSAVIDAETGHDAVDDEEAVFVGGEVGGERVEEFELVLAVEGAGVGDVFLGGVGVHCGGVLGECGREGW